ncbi:MAG: type III pantothenate kinase [Woeseiaceae bacterium]|nr:type III pantothenate kinase [Woeseiaceae bacterium]|tara:strand:- start:4526 stop:5290 length:765 start_codon:yes stop_codon:yes gene_type:complete
MKNAKILLLDIGNTYIKWGLLEKSKLNNLNSMRNTNFLSMEHDDLKEVFPTDIGRVIVSSVAAEDIDRKLSELIESYYDCSIEFACSELSAHGVKSGYKNATQLGVDRWVAMIAARAHFSGDVTVIDLGTAVTIDTIDKNGKHIGGQIFPGLQLMLNSLNQRTDRISLSLHNNNHTNTKNKFWGDKTDDAIVFGACNAICGAIERAIRSLQESGYSPTIILTGGDASTLKSLMDKDYIHRPNLVLEGLVVIANN